MLSRWRDRLPAGSLFRRPLVFDITLVLCIKAMLLFALWWFAFRPLEPSQAPNLLEHLGMPSSLVKDTNHE